MLNDPSHWRRLVAEYRELRRLAGGMTPQQRGQRFNGLVAELLTVFGVPAQADQRSVGEIDVTFRHANRPFILEAKWERQKTSTGPIAKLQRRVEQRMVGVVGVFLSMEGYTAEAREDLVRGRRLDIVLLDRNHWEAMLSGFVPPQELLDLVVDAAAFKGDAFVPLRQLLEHKPPAVTIRRAPTPSRRGASGPATADPTSVIVETARYPHLGLSAADENTALVTLKGGVAAINLVSGQLRWEAAFSGCDNAALKLSDGSLLLSRQHGIGCYRDGVLSIVAAGSTAPRRGQLLAGPNGSAWLFDRGGEKQDLTPPALIKLGASLGDEEHHLLPPAGRPASSATFLDDGSYAIATGGKVFTAPNNSESPELALPSGAAITDLATLKGELLVALDSKQRLHLMRLDSRKIDVIESSELTTDQPVRIATDGRASIFVASQQQAGGRNVLMVHRLAKSAIPAPRQQPQPAPLFTSDVPTGVPHVTTVRSTPSEEAFRPPLPPRFGLDVDTPISALPAGGAAAQDLHWHVEQERAAADGRALAMELPLHVLPGLIAANFDVRAWIEPWRQYWLKVSSGHAPPDESLLGWLPMAARFLGAHVAPEGFAEARLRPSAAYLVGFAAGLRATVSAAADRKLIEPDAERMRQWLDQGTCLSDGKLVRAATLRDLEEAVRRARTRSAVGWLGRGVLWLATGFFALGTAVAIHLSLTGGWPEDSLTNTLVGLLFYTVPFAFLLWQTIRDVRRMRARK
ncbi:restriction endonuclease [Micromonospora chalcea]|uniref:restriction endonuclease n=1 Tax=Micromonospora chalcea TaxID=1874 RepID=UPI00381EE6F4